MGFALAALGGLVLFVPPRLASWTQAGLLMVDSDVMAVVALVVCASIWALVGAAQRRAITPHSPLLACATVGSFDALLAHRSLIAAGDQRGHSSGWGSGDDTGLAAALIPSAATAWLARAVAVALLSIGAVIVLGTSGHLPRAGTADLAAVLMAAVWLALAGTVWTLHIRRQEHDSPVTRATRVAIARRGPHALVVAVIGEIALGLSVAFVAAVLSHTAGSPAPGVLEVVAIALLARLFTFVPSPPLGLGVADGVLVFGLTLINVPTEVAIATTLVWRVAGLVVITVGLRSARSPRSHVASAARVVATPTDSRLGRFVHRSGFALLALLPGRLASVARRRLFDAMFGLADDPWGYALMPYEERKQAHLVAVIPSGAGVIVELGCADGHNLAALARLHPGSTVIGIDISERAITTATQRIRSHANAMVIRADARSVGKALGEFRGSVKVLVLSEVLYYLGTSPQVQQELGPARALLSPDATVVLVHGAHDARRLHLPACTALGVVAVADTVVDDPDRPYIVTVAHAPRDKGAA